MDKHSLQLLLAQGVSVERIAKRFGKDPSTISYWLKKHGLSSQFAEKHAARGALDRQRLEECVEAGMTIAEIAAEVDRSKATVRHWLKRYGLRTSSARSQRIASWRAAKEAGQLEVTMSCRRHGVTDFALEGRGYYRCKRCRAEQIVRHRRNVKATLVEEAGGRCLLCGYDRVLGALHFHHLDPTTKRLEVGRGVGLSMRAIRDEARKCVLLCSNCHAEVESGDTDLPLEFLPRPEV